MSVVSLRKRAFAAVVTDATDLALRVDPQLHRDSRQLTPAGPSLLVSHRRRIHFGDRLPDSQSDLGG
jgi:hypothetical protein